MKRSLAALLLLSSQLATAQPVDKTLGKKEFADGKVSYASGDYLAAALHFTNAYKADPDPAYIFNVGQAYRRRAEAKSGNVPSDCQQSMFAYQKFLDLLPEAPNKSEVEGYIKEMTSCAGKLAKEPSPWNKPVDGPPDPIDKPPPIDNPPPIDKPIGERPIEGPPIDRPSGGLTTMQYTGIGVGAAGVIVGGVGLYFLGRSRNFESKRQDIFDAVEQAGEATPQQEQDVKQLDKDGKSANNRAWGFGITGGVAVIGGVILFVTGGSSAKEQKLTVAPSPQGAMVLGNFRF